MPIFFAYGGQFEQVRNFHDCLMHPYVSRQLFTTWSVLGLYSPMAGASLVYSVIFIRYRVQAGRITAGRPSIPQNGPLRNRRRGMAQRRLAVTRMLCFFWLWQCTCILPLIIVQVFVLPRLIFRPQTSVWLWVKSLQLCAYAFTPVYNSPYILFLTKFFWLCYPISKKWFEKLCFFSWLQFIFLALNKDYQDSLRKLWHKIRTGETQSVVRDRSSALDRHASMAPSLINRYWIVQDT